jgi:cell division septation protein DedD
VSAGRQAENTTKTYSIQVGVFSSLQGARQVVDDLARGGYPARISPDKRGAQTLYRVVTGRYQSEYAARKALEQLRTEGFEAFLIEQQ